MGVRQYWRYELASGEVDVVSTLPIDAILAEKRKINVEISGIEFTSFCIWSALQRKAKKEGSVMNAFEVWQVEDLIDYDVLTTEEWKEENNVVPFDASKTQQPTESAV